MSGQSENDKVKSPALEQQAAELSALRRMLEISRDCFSLSVAVCNSPALRDYVIDQLQNEGRSVCMLSVEPDTANILNLAQEITKDKTFDALFIVNMEQIVPSGREDYPVLRTLNFTRELWKKEYACPVVFWMPEYTATLLSRYARDLWSWLSHHFEFVSETATVSAGMQDQYAGDIMLAGNLSAEQKQFRMAELQQRISEAGDTPGKEIVMHVLVWLNELAYLFQQTGDLDRAEQTHLKALAIEEKLGQQEGMAIQYGNLGVIYFIRGELEQGERMLKKSLEINEKLVQQEGMASNYGNLGLIYADRGELDQAERMLKKSLEINKKLGRQEGMASNYGNLGAVYINRGELEQAEWMYKKSLEINEKLGRQEGIAADYGNLGVIYSTRGEIEKARQYGHKALELFKKIGMEPEIKKVQGWLAGLEGSEQ